MFRTISIATGALFAVAGCSADTIYFTGLPSTYQNGTYNGYATAIVNGISNQFLICDDYYDETYMPSPATMIYNYSTLTGSNPLQYAMWDTSSSAVNTQKYDEAAVLLYGLSLAGPNASATTITDYQYALWNLMNPTAPFAAGRSTQEKALQSSALVMVNSSSEQSFLATSVYPGLQIYTPTKAFVGNQEFLEFAQVATPEPSSGQMLGAILAAGLLAIFVTRRAERKRRERTPES